MEHQNSSWDRQTSHPRGQYAGAWIKKRKISGRKAALSSSVTTMSRYELDRLGFYQFEWLIQVLLKAEFGTAIEAWGGHADHGRDAYSAKRIRSDSKNKSYPGPVVFQAKFVSGANAAGAKSHDALVAACKLESQRIMERKKKRQWAAPASYFFFTTAPVSASARTSIKHVLEPVLGFDPVVLGFFRYMC
jgi:hypothetical protein